MQQPGADAHLLSFEVRIAELGGKAAEPFVRRNTPDFRRSAGGPLLRACGGSYNAREPP